MQGASPLASPRLDGARHWLSLPYRCLGGGGGITRRERFLSVLRRPIGSAAGVPGAKPPAKSTKNLPLPRRGRGVGGMGEKEKGQGGGGGWQSRQAPQRIPERQSHPATTRASSPQGATVARSANAARVQPRGCKGLSPLHKKTKKSPPSPEGKSALRARAGGWGQKSYDAAGKAGAAGTSHPAGQQRRQGKPVPPSVPPPLNAPACGA